jgi:hypothetical protein
MKYCFEIPVQSDLLAKPAKLTRILACFPHLSTANFSFSTFCETFLTFLWKSDADNKNRHQHVEITP